MTASTNQPYRFERDRDAASLQEQFASLGAGEETGVVVSVAGRVMLHRPTGKLTFSTLVDSSGSIQLFSNVGWTNDYDAIHSRDNDVAAIRLALADFRGELTIVGDQLRAALAAQEYS